jgi:hypothetical protein
MLTTAFSLLLIVALTVQPASARPGVMSLSLPTPTVSIRPDDRTGLQYSPKTTLAPSPLEGDLRKRVADTDPRVCGFLTNGGKHST